MDREMQTSLLALCALDHVNWHVIAREAQQPLGLERLLRGQLTEMSKQARETQKLIAGASGDLAEQRLRAVKEIRRAEDAGAKLVTVLDDDYPANLRVIYWRDRDSLGRGRTRTTPLAYRGGASLGRATATRTRARVSRSEQSSPARWVR
jgi:predicted Rossmann fold nucleotide-binding protein DprA/Smf involved in DNA uptake